jgi:hypothetical protein
MLELIGTLALLIALVTGAAVWSSRKGRASATDERSGS